MSTPNDLQALLANLRPPAARSSSEQANQPSFTFNSSQQLDVLTTTNGSQSHSSFPVNTSFSGLQERDDRASNLLSLLKSSQPGASSSIPSTSTPPGSASFHTPQTNTSSEQPPHTRQISASDLVASFMAKPSTPNTQGVTSPPTHGGGGLKPSSAQEDPQDILLRLLNRQKDIPKINSPAQENKPIYQRVPEAVVDDLKQDAADAAAQDVNPTTNRSNGASPSPRVFGNERQSFLDQNASIERQRTPSKPVFTYVNPFDQLAASSPRNRTPKPEPTSGRASPVIELLKKDADGVKRKSQESSPEPSLRRKLTPVGAKNQRSHSPNPVPIIEPKTESVSNALGEVAGQVDKQAEDALARADDCDDVPIKQEQYSQGNSMDLITEKLQEAAIEIKKELDKEENEGALEDILPAQAAESIMEMINDAANGDLVDEHWVSADGEESPSKEDDEDHDARVVKVYNFPVKPFVTISVKNPPDPDVRFRDDGVMDIARLKKNFDQTDRTLACATSEYIVYTQVKTGGVRVIRQDDGVDRSLFKGSDDRVFNVSIPTTPYKGSGTYSQNVLATGVSGSVYWAPIFHAQKDLFDSDSMETEALVFPPSSAGEDSSSTSGGQLKTRARRSCRHPEYFAIGRGKSIHMVFTLPAAASKYRKAPGVVDTEQFFKDRNLKITTGKAGKDFSFSEDDTVVVSLDKNGKVKFWDIRELVEGSNPTANKVEPVDINTPIMTLSSVPTSKDKPWPSSVMLLDKARPYARGIALRYMIVGLKQNHTLQLWDLGLGKPVQELNFPHSSDADAICSLGYDPNTGVLVVGHPTRNSIFLVHLSAPRYALKPMCQADYLQRVVSKDPRVQAVESTAFLSGIREISFAPKGQLRSVELLSTNLSSKATSTAGTETTQDSTIFFELYVMHSRGVTCLRINREDCGWDDDNRIIKPIDAEKEGIIELTNLRDPQEESVSGIDTPTPTPGKAAGSDKKKAGEQVVTRPAPTESDPSLPNGQSKGIETSQEHQQASSSGDKSEKKKKNRNKSGNKKFGESPEVQSQGAGPNITQPSIIAKDTTASVDQIENTNNLASNTSPEVPNTMDPTKPEFIPSTPTKSSRPAPSETINLGISGDFLDKEIKKIEKGVAAEMSKVIHRELENLHRALGEDKRVMEAKDAAKTEAVLRLVSSTLNENVEKSLGHTISDNMQRFVVPAMQNVTKQVIENHIAKVVERSVTGAVGQNLGLWMTREMHNHLPNALVSTFHNPDVVRMISEVFATKVHNIVYTAVNAESTKQAAAMANAETKFSNQLTELNAKVNNLTAQVADTNAKLGHNTGILRGITETISTMATAQADFQAELLKQGRQRGSSTDDRDAQENQLTSYAAATSSETTASPTIRSPTKTPEEIELADITEMMTEGRYQEGTIKWLRSSRTLELFDEFFVQCSPAYLSSLSPLIALSVGVVISQAFDTNVFERLNWLETLLTTVNFQDPDIQEIAPEIMDKLVGRLEGFYMEVAEVNPQNPILRKVPPLTRRAREIKGGIRRAGSSNHRNV